MAPEQVVGQPAEAAADVFALGSVLVYAATGEPPFGTDEATTVMYRTVHNAPMLDGVAEPLRSVVEACLEKDPASRPTPTAVIERVLGLLGYIPPRPEAIQSGQAAETVSTPAIDPARNPAEHTALSGEPTQDSPALSNPGDVAANPYLELPAYEGLGPSVQRPVRRFALRVRKRPFAIATLGVVLAVSGTLAALAATHQHANGNGNSTQTRRQLSPGSSSLTSHSPAAAGSTDAALPQRFVTGPGCAASPWAGTTQSIPAADQRVPNVGGGDPECGGVTVAFRKSGSTAPADSGFTWEFHLRRAAHCALSIYVANTSSSSGIALYQVTVAGTTSQFRLHQAQAKGQWVQQPGTSGLDLTDGTVRLRLTDAGSYVGDRFHVTASAVRADCS
jgi:hypothetical protein